MGQGQHADAGAHADPLGAGGDDAGHHQGDRRHRRDAGSARIRGRARRGEVALGQPDAIDARLVGQLGDSKGFVEGFVLGTALAVIAFHYQTDVHGDPPQSQFLKPPSPSMGEGWGEGEIAAVMDCPLTPTLSRQGRGNQWAVLEDWQISFR